MQKKISVFISRDLSPDSPFLQALPAERFEVYGESLIQLTPLPFSDLPSADWVFFYSKNGVRHFFDGLNNAGLTLPDNVKIAAMGTATANMIDVEVDFCGNGDPEQTARSFYEVAKNKKVLFPRAAKSVRSIQQLLKNKIKEFDLVVYENKMKKELNIPKTEVVVFTSPLNVEAYSTVNKIQNDQLIISIGPTTAKSIQKHFSGKVHIADGPTEKHLAKVILDFYK